jgi:hypothetical protein
MDLLNFLLVGLALISYVASARTLLYRCWWTYLPGENSLPKGSRPQFNNSRLCVDEKLSEMTGLK